jgi:hypothetical protein
MAFRFLTKIFLFIFIVSCTQKGPYDVVDKENNKIGILFEKAIAEEKERIANGREYPGIKPDCIKRMNTYLNSIKHIESYASKGTASNDKFNQVEIKITFNDGTIANKIYTGKRVVQAYGMGAQFLVKMELADGKVVKSYTNGAEKNNSPDYIRGDIALIKEKVLRYDWKINRNDYFYPAKTQEDVEKEWRDIK